jgi:N-acetylglucosaminyldiphosphoundecaprenol N-acetyl-beta-D-mannosaminyltransferase
MQFAPPVEADVRAAVGATGSVLGVEYFVGDPAAATELVLERAGSGLGGFSCLAGVHGIVHAQHSPDLMAALSAAWMNFPDGAPVAWLLRRNGWRTSRRVAGPDLMPAVIDAGRSLGLRHYLFGSTPETLDLLQRRLEGRYPGVQIAGTMSPPFRPLSEHEEDEIAAQIRACEPHIVWVGLGLPKQDQWMHRNAARLGPTLALGVGAAFDFLAGTKARAPRGMQALGLEWLHRLSSEPRRLAPRYISTNSEFLARASLQLAHRYPTRLKRALRPRGSG